MKSFPFSISIIILTIFTFFLASDCATTKKSAPGFIGSWNYTVYDTPEGDVPGEFIISQSDNGYTGKFKVRGMTIDMQDLKIEDDKISCYMWVEGYKVNFSGQFEGNNFEGTGSFDDNEFKFTAVKSE